MPTLCVTFYVSAFVLTLYFRFLVTSHYFILCTSEGVFIILTFLFFVTCFRFGDNIILCITDYVFKRERGVYDYCGAIKPGIYNVTRICIMWFMYLISGVLSPWLCLMPSFWTQKLLNGGKNVAKLTP